MKAHLERTYFGRPLGMLLIIFYKTLWGSVEAVSGILVFFSLPLIANELAEDPQDLLANWIIQHIHISPVATATIGELLLLFGLSKIALAVALWYEFRHIRTLMVAFFGAIAAYGLYDLLTTTFSVLTFFTFLADLAILFYAVYILPHYMPKKKP